MKDVAVIGAGISGLAAAKYLREFGLNPVVFEGAPDLGGLWNPLTGAMWFSLRTNTSRFTCMFSDFPWKEGSELNPNQRQMFEYIHDYAQYFNLRQFIQFNTQVLKVSQHQNEWGIEYKNQSGIHQRNFQFVIVATGIFSKPKYPNIPGLADFKGQVIHSRDYKSPEYFQDKNVLVLGGAYSGAEISADLAPLAKKVFNSISYPCWVIDRQISDKHGNSLPIDLIFYHRNTRQKAEEVDIKTPDDFKKSNYFFGQLCRHNQKQTPYFLDPQSSDPTRVIVANKYIENIDNGNIIFKKSKVKAFANERVLFEDGSSEAVDVIILSTGYTTDLSFLDQKILQAMDYQPEDQFQPVLLHKCSFNPHLPNMGFVGMYRGPYMAFLELQAKWISLVFSQKISLPSQEEMELGMVREKTIREQKPRPQFPHPDYVGMTDDLAKRIGVYPHPESLTDTSIKEFVTHGVVFPPVYQLVGHGAKPEIALAEIKKINQVVNKNSMWNQKTLSYAARALITGLGIYTAYKGLSSSKPGQSSGLNTPGLK